MFTIMSQESCSFVKQILKYWIFCENIINKHPFSINSEFPNRPRSVINVIQLPGYENGIDLALYTIIVPAHLLDVSASTVVSNSVCHSLKLLVINAGSEVSHGTVARLSLSLSKLFRILSR